MRHEKLGLEIEIVTHEAEAKLAVSGCASLIDRNCDWSLVFDIGGGCSELICSTFPAERASPPP